MKKKEIYAKIKDAPEKGAGNKQMNTQGKNILQLRKCAYIFDNVGNFLYGTRQQIQEQRETLAEVKKYYDDEKKRAQWIPYTIKNEHTPNGEAFPVISIIINGKPHTLNALQIAKIKGEAEFNSIAATINSRAEININDFPKDEPGTNARNFCHSSLLFKDFASLEVENFTGADDLGFIRIHFKNRYTCFIVDDNGEFFTAYGVNHNKTTAPAILKQLNATSTKIKTLLTLILNYISAKAKADNQ